MNFHTLERIAAFATVIAAGLVPLSSNAEIFKCVSKEGKITFQDSPCLGTTGSAVTVRPTNNGVVVMNPRAAARAPAGKTDADESRAGAPPTPAGPAVPLTPAQRDALQLKAMENERRLRGLDYDVAEAESTLAALNVSMDRELGALRTRKEALTNSVPGTVLEQNVATELQIASERYQQQVRAAQDRVTELRKARDDLAASSKTDARAGQSTAGAAGAAASK